MQEITRMFKKALISGNIASIHDFLKRYQHADIANWRLDGDGHSALHYLSYVEVSVDELLRRRLVRLLLEYGANVNLKAKFDVTPIFDACELPSELLVECFIKYGADVDIVDADGQTVLFSAIEHNEVDMLVDLINAGADAVVDVIDENGDAAIHGTLTHPLAEIGALRVLINAGANLDIQNKNGHTLLHLNVLFHKNEAAARLLLEKGADYSIEDINGVTALQDAAKSEFYPLIDFLIKEGVSLQDNNRMLLEACVENFKIVLLENPTLLKPIALIGILNDEKTYLSNKWHAIQKELIKMQNTKVGGNQYSFYDILMEKNPIKLKNMLSHPLVIEAINDNTLEDFPNFSLKIKNLKNYMKRIEGARTSYSIYDIYTEKDKNKLARIFLNRKLENKVKDLLNSEADVDNVVRRNLWRNLKIGVERRDLLQASLDFNSDSNGVKRLPLEMIQEILKYLSLERLRDITFAGLSIEENREIDSDLAKNVAQLFVMLSSYMRHDRNLPTIFRGKNVNDVFVFLKTLTVEQFTAIFDGVKRNIPLLIHNADDFYIAFKNLNAEQRVMMFDYVKEKLPSMIRDADDFYHICKNLNAEQRAILFDQVKELLPSFIEVADDFYRIFKNLNAEQRAILLDSTKKTLPSIIKNADDFYFVFMSLNIEQRVNIFDQVKGIFPSITRTADDFYAVFKYLNADQRTVVFESVKEKLLSIIFRADEFYLILENLSSEQRATAFNFVRQKLPLLIRCSDDFHMILENLNAEQRTVIFNSVKEKLFIFSAYDFYMVTKNLNVEQRAIIFNVVKGNLPSMIFNKDDVYYVFKSLNPEQHAITFKNIKEKVLSIIKHVNDLTTIFSVFNTEQRLDVLKTLEEKLPFIIHNADAYSAIIRDLKVSERTYLDQLLKFHKYNLLARDSRLSSFESCLPGSSAHRLEKRNTLEDACQFSWEDVDKFNAEKEKSREFNKIKINSDQFIATLENLSLSETKRAQLLGLADKLPVVGSSQERVIGLMRDQKNLRYLHKVGRLSGMLTQGMMVKNTLRDFFQEDYEGVAINIGFIAGGQGFAKMAVAASVQGKRFVAKGQRLLGQSLSVASPFLARGTSVFIAYDLVEQIKAYKKGNPDAVISMLGDGIYLGIDGVETGIEIAEGFELLEGVSSVTGPIGATIGAVVFISTDIYSAVKCVDKIDQQIHLTGIEKLIEGVRAFVGMQPEQYVERLLEEKQVNNELFTQGLAFLKNNTDVERTIFPTVKVVTKCITIFVDRACQTLGYSVPTRCFPNLRRTNSFVPKEVVGRCTDKLEINLDNTIILDRKRNNIKWSRTKPDEKEGSLFCVPTGNDVEIPSDGAYLCENAMGIEYSDFRTGNTTVIKLGDGNDIVIGFPQADHMLMLGNGHKSILLGNGNDIFLLEGTEVSGFLQAGGGY